MPYPFATQIRWQSANVFDTRGFRGSRRVRLQAVAFGSLPAKKRHLPKDRYRFLFNPDYFQLSSKWDKKNRPL